jgi:hypothetical protein
MRTAKFLPAFGLCGLCLAVGLSPSFRARAQDADPDAAAPKDSSSSSEKPSGTIENSVVKVFATERYPDPYKPWTKQSPSEVSASGVVIEGKRTLSNAHVVLYASQLQI